MKKFQRFCTLFLLMIGLCSFALHAQSYAGLWRQVEQPNTSLRYEEVVPAKQAANAPAAVPGNIMAAISAAVTVVTQAIFHPALNVVGGKKDDPRFILQTVVYADEVGKYIMLPQYRP